ncbi:MAG: DUF167 domain-containing protein [Pirellulales bacterium]|nr:DUF167 domain-containing protein [Pirellulales bacterium]
MIALETSSEGVLLPVQARPAARKCGVLGEHGGALKFGVAEAAEKGQANRALIEGLAETLGLRPNQLSLVRGATSRAKRVLVRGISQQELSARLDKLLS